MNLGGYRTCGEERFAWEWKSWRTLANWPKPESCTIVLPVCGFSEWVTDGPFDQEEQILTALLRRGLRNCNEQTVLTLPLLRFVVGDAARSVFTVVASLAHAQIEEIAASVQAAGFRRLVFLNSSPENEPLCDVAARDLRIDLGLQTFCVQLSALHLKPGRVPSDKDLEEAADNFAALLREIASRPALPDEGCLRTKRRGAS
jgi:creatinine amidohydrolase